jgi:hypothetical protein
MQKARFIALLAMVIVMAAATVWMAWVWSAAGAPVWQAAIGPVLLAIVLLLRWKSTRRT